MDPHGVENTTNLFIIETAWRRFFLDYNFDTGNPIPTPNPNPNANVKHRFLQHVYLIPYIEHGELQKSEGICTQWATILGLTYVLNTKEQKHGRRSKRKKRDDDDEEDDDDDSHRRPAVLEYPNDVTFEYMQKVMAFLETNEKRIVTTFMFWVHLMSEKLNRFVTQTDLTAFTPAEFEELFSVPETMWPMRPANIPLSFLTSEEDTCVFDMYHCPLATREIDCKSPCRWDETQGMCRNAALFEMPPPPPKDVGGDDSEPSTVL